MKEVDLVNEVCDKFSEWLEMMEPEEAESFIRVTLANMVIKERENAEFYKKNAYPRFGGSL